ncbi:UDP-N-acetylenolpyruvoylglucosamine reductase [Candidatus Kaiserbacteria bacterium]|nr:MAG: UDP-N-acetylenolpyruvoylglucosamine reductase [Candidatus Kaiserbacteria bacterium]
MITIQENINLSEHTTFEIGGNARYFVEVNSMTDLEAALEYAKENRLKYFVFSGGSNLLVSDEGFDGLAIKISMSVLSITGTEVVAEAGCSLMEVIHETTLEKLGGMESMYGIPGSVGGALRGNAGAFGTEMKDVVKEVTAFNVWTHQLRKFSNIQCKFGYRDSYFKKDKDWVILSVTFSLTKDEKSHNKAHMTLSLRNERQIQGIKSAGSFFENPLVNTKIQKMFFDEKGVEAKDGRVPAGWLIEKSGFRGVCENGVCTGERSSNYVINEEGDSEAVIALTTKIKEKVFRDHGVELVLEVTTIDSTE